MLESTVKSQAVVCCYRSLFRAQNFKLTMKCNRNTHINNDDYFGMDSDTNEFPNEMYCGGGNLVTFYIFFPSQTVTILK